MATKDQRRRQLAREKFLRQQERRDDHRKKARRRNAVIAAALAVCLAGGAAAFAAGGLGGDDDKKDDAAGATPSASADPSQAPDPCEKPAKGAVGTKQWKKEPALSIDKSADYTMKLQTTCGDIGVKLDAANAPRTVNSFNFLASKGYFDHTKCHRMTSGGLAVLQCGDPQGTGSGGPGYELPDENLKDSKLEGNVYPAGTVAMANAGPDTGGSQFFLVIADSQLEPNYTPFGTVDKAGMEVLKKIAAAGIQGGGADGPPVATAVLDKVTVSKK